MIKNNFALLFCYKILLAVIILNAYYRKVPIICTTLCVAYICISIHYIVFSNKNELQLY